MATLDVEKARLAGISEEKIQAYMKANNLTPKKTVGGFMRNIAESAVKTAQGIVQPLTQPVQTAKDLGNLVIGVAQLAIPGAQDKEKFARALGQFYLDRYGSFEKAANTIYQDPVGVVADISTVIGGGAGVLKAGGQATKISGLTKAGRTLEALTPEATIAKGIGKVTPKGITKKIGAKIEQTGKEYALRGIRPSQSSIKKFNSKYKTPLEDWVAKQGLTVDQLEELRNSAIPTSQTSALEPLYTQRKSAIRKTGQSVSAEELQNAFRKRINKLRTGANADVPQKQKLAQDLENYLEQYIGTREPTITDPLLQKARKYKTLEEYIKAQGKPVYHGTPDKNFKTFSMDRAGSYSGTESARVGIWFTNDPKVADKFTYDNIYINTPETKNGRIIESYFKLENPKVYNKVEDVSIYQKAIVDIENKIENLNILRKLAKNWNEEKALLKQIANLQENDLPRAKGLVNQLKNDKGDPFKLYESEVAKYGSPEKYVEALKKEGYDGIVIKGTRYDAGKGTNDQIAVFDPSKIKTKSQLTDIWNEAQQIKPKTVRQRDVAEKIPLSDIDDLRSQFDIATKESEFMQSPDTSFNRIMGDTLRKIVNEKAKTTDVGRKISQFEDFAEIARKAPSGKGNIPLGLGTGVYMRSLESVPVAGPLITAGVREYINAPKTVQRVSQATQKIGRAMQKKPKASKSTNIFKQAVTTGLETGKATRLLAPENMQMKEETPTMKKPDRFDLLLQQKTVEPKVQPQTKTPTTTNAFAKVKKLRKGAFV